MKTKLGDIAYITKLAGYEHTKYIQGNISHCRDAQHEVPLFIGKTVRNGKIDEEYDWFLPSSISDLLPRSQLTKKCIVMPYVGSLGDLAIFYANERCHLGSNICKIELQKGCKYNEEFVYFFLKSPEGQARLFRNVQGAVQKNITMESIRNIELPDASEYTQRQIVACLSAIDAKIENNNAVCADLEGMAKLLYDYWFVQFDFPDENGNPYKSSGGKMVWNEELKREIPDGWGCFSLGKIASIVNETVDPQRNRETVFEHYSIPAFDDGAFPVIERGSDIDSGKYAVPQGAILVSKLNPQFKRIWDPLCIGTNCICSTEFMPVVANVSTKRAFLFSLLNSDTFQKYMVQASSSSTGSRKRMQPELCGKFLFASPTNNDIFLNFSALVDPMLATIKNARIENNDLIQLRDFLLPMLMNGQVKVG